MAEPPVEAVTALICVDQQVLMVRRQPFLLAFPGYHAFPGGKVDAADQHGAPVPAVVDGELPDPVLRALLRELHEELGLTRAELARCRARFAPMGRALSPPIVPRRFDTWFVRVTMDERPTLHIDAAEAAEGGWDTAQGWLERYAAGAALMTPPTRRHLATLAAGPDTSRNVAEAAQPAEAAPPLDSINIPVIETLSGVRQLLVRSHTLPPAQHTNCFLVGDPRACRVMVDPAPRDPDEFERLCRRVDELGVDEILLTHHHLDHRERANRLAQRFGLPLAMSAVTQQRIARADPGYFDGCAVRELVDGDVVSHWKGQAVRVLEVPGHDDGHLALMPEDRAWCIVGDLIQGVGTVVIKRPEGDMARYLASLTRIIDLAPRAIFPSHGSGLGTVYRLEETLRHRLDRERRVLELARDGLDIDAMLPRIYTDLDPRLMPLARMNIEAHLDKLRDEGRVRA